jgi:FHS family Na+ dependent glucose MFS transporter 1
MTSTPSSPRPLVATAAYYLSFITLGLVVAVLGPSLLALAEQTASALDQISLVFVVGSLGYMASSFQVGRLYDRVPAHRLMAAGLLFLGASTALIPLMPGLWLLLLVMFFQGLANGIVDVGCNTLLQWVHGEKVGPYMNGLHAFFGVGTFIAPLLLARFLTSTGEIHWTFWTMGLVTVPLGIWLWLLPSPRPQVHTEERATTPIPWVPVILVSMCFFFYVGAEIGFGNWIATYAVMLNLADKVQAARLTSAFWGAFTAARLLGVWISSRVRPRTILLVDLLGCLASLGLILLSLTSHTLLWAGSIGLGLFMASIFATQLIFAGERMRVTGTITGVFLTGAGFGGMVLPWFIGQVFESWGPVSMMFSILGALTLNLLMIAYLAASRPAVAPQAT